MVGKNRKNIFLRYILVSIFVSIIFYLRVSPSCTPIGDEQRYIDYANNLWNGFYSPDFPNIFIWNGPGYPIFLMPFIKI